MSCSVALFGTVTTSSAMSKTFHFPTYRTPSLGWSELDFSVTCAKGLFGRRYDATSSLWGRCTCWLDRL
ncbi:unnamed protein product [Symbiodinium sp. KB8]|nr:unnamed protein product [Symbiodinium sp. KB8]